MFFTFISLLKVSDAFVSSFPFISQFSLLTESSHFLKVKILSRSPLPGSRFCWTSTVDVVFFLHCLF